MAYPALSNLLNLSHPHLSLKVYVMDLDISSEEQIEETANQLFLTCIYLCCW